mmetsp:Transcript_31125/g.41528  ORF Transcript_31125/g.41528 Transcript_31125/m.41528 type:complete len:243 (-) Transcript_31125:925-1653(-)
MRPLRPPLRQRPQSASRGPQQLLRRRLRLPQPHELIRQVRGRRSAQLPRRQPRLQRRPHPEAHHGLRRSDQNASAQQSHTLPRIQIHRRVLRVQGGQDSESARHSRGGAQVLAHGPLREETLPQIPHLRRSVRARQARHPRGQGSHHHDHARAVHFLWPCGGHARVHLPRHVSQNRRHAPGPARCTHRQRTPVLLLLPRQVRHQSLHLPHLRSRRTSRGLLPPLRDPRRNIHAKPRRGRNYL